MWRFCQQLSLYTRVSSLRSQGIEGEKQEEKDGQGKIRTPITRPNPQNALAFFRNVM